MKKKTTKGAKTKKADPKAKTKTKKKSAATTSKSKKKKVVERTHILALIDKSGSMDKVKSDAIGGFNTFLKAQKKGKDKATMDVVQFSSYDSITPVPHDQMIDVSQVEELTEENYVPYGSTALHDAMVQSFTGLKLKINDLKPSKRPHKILVMIITDGRENDSREYPKEMVGDVRRLVLKRKEENWQFIFLCSTEDTALAGESLGFSKGNVHKYSNDSAGNKTMFAAVAKAAMTYRSTSMNSKSFARTSNNLLAEDVVYDEPTKEVDDIV